LENRFSPMPMTAWTCRVVDEMKTSSAP